MSERARNTLFASVIVVMASLVVFLVASSPTPADRVDQLGSQIKCPVCQGESIANSPADMARDMMSLVEERVAQGATDQQIIDELLSSYSGALLLDPPASGNTLLLWLAPVAALVAGVGVILWWRRHPGDEQEAAGTPPSESQSRSTGRTLVGGLILAGAFAGIVVAAGFFLQDDGSQAEDGTGTAAQDLSEVSNETMEAVIAANLDNPQVNGMRLALAERYFETSDYRSAFPHFLAVVESTQATSGEAVTALVRLGWMAWDGNAEVETAIDLFDEALRINPGSTTASFLKARVLWCGSGDSSSAEELLGRLVDDPALDDESRTVIETDLAAMRNGEDCS